MQNQNRKKKLWKRRTSREELGLCYNVFFVGSCCRHSYLQGVSTRQAPLRVSLPEGSLKHFGDPISKRSQTEDTGYAFCEISLRSGLTETILKDGLVLSVIALF